MGSDDDVERVGVPQFALDDAPLVAKLRWSLFTGISIPARRTGIAVDCDPRTEVIRSAACGATITGMAVNVRDSERIAADAFTLALRGGHIQGLDAYPDATWEVGDDPPDLLVNLGARIVGVELANVVSESYAKRASKDRAQARRRERVSSFVWTPDPCAEIERVIRDKTANGVKRNLGGFRLLLHDFVADIPGAAVDAFHSQSLAGHAHYREACADALANASPFVCVILQTHIGVPTEDLAAGSPVWSVLHSAT